MVLLIIVAVFAYMDRKAASQAQAVISGTFAAPRHKYRCNTEAAHLPQRRMGRLAVLRAVPLGARARIRQSGTPPNGSPLQPSAKCYAYPPHPSRLHHSDGARPRGRVDCRAADTREDPTYARYPRVRHPPRLCRHRRQLAHAPRLPRGPAHHERAGRAAHQRHLRLPQHVPQDGRRLPSRRRRGRLRPRQAARAHGDTPSVQGPAPAHGRGPARAVPHDQEAARRAVRAHPGGRGLGGRRHPGHARPRR